MSAATALKDDTPSLAERLGEFTADIAYARLPASTVAAVKRLLLDTLGCALGALDAEPVRLLEPFAPWQRAAMKLAGMQPPLTHFYQLTECQKP